MIYVVSYGCGNIASVVNMIKKAGGNAVICDDPSQLKFASKIVLPGVGSFDNAMHKLKDGGWVEPLNEEVLGEKKSVLGICLGMQLMCNYSEEGCLGGLSWIDADVLRFEMGGKGLKVPHMGWNNIKYEPNPIFDGLDSESRFYFVHSYYARCKNEKNVLAKCVYGLEFDAAIVNENIIGMQFHPEKSHIFGLKVMENFVRLGHG